MGRPRPRMATMLPEVHLASIEAAGHYAQKEQPERMATPGRFLWEG